MVLLEGCLDDGVRGLSVFVASKWNSTNTQESSKLSWSSQASLGWADACCRFVISDPWLEKFARDVLVVMDH